MKNEAEEEEDKKNKKTKRGRKGTIWSLLSQRKEKPFADPPKDSSNSSPFSPPLNNSSDKQIQRDLINQLQNFQKSSNKLRSVNDEGNKQIFSTAQTSLKSNFEAFENEVLKRLTSSDNNNNNNNNENNNENNQPKSLRLTICFIFILIKLFI